MPPRGANGWSDGGESEKAAARARERAKEIESEKARLRRELDDAKREMEERQQQQQRERERRRAREQASAKPDAGSPWANGTPRAAAAKVEAVDHAAIFASGVVPAKKSHYAMLGVPRSAGPDEIKKAYNKLAMKWHPDKNPSETAKAELVFMGIKDSYECLIDPIKRRRYDRTT